MDTQRSLSLEDAAELWRQAVPRLGVAIAKKIWKMGMPCRKEAPRNFSDLDSGTPGTGAVKWALMRDKQFHEDIIQATAREFLETVRRGKLRHDSKPGIVFTIARCVTLKLATRRAREMLRTMASRTDVPAVDLVPSKLPNAESCLLTKEKRLRAAKLLRSLTEEERELLSAKADGSYEELALKLAVKPSALRTRASRLCDRLRAELNRKDLK